MNSYLFSLFLVNDYIDGFSRCIGVMAADDLGASFYKFRTAIDDLKNQGYAIDLIEDYLCTIPFSLANSQWLIEEYFIRYSEVPFLSIPYWIMQPNKEVLLNKLNLTLRQLNYIVRDDRMNDFIETKMSQEN